MDNPTRFFIYEPGDQVAFFSTKTNWELNIRLFDFYDKYCDETWNDDVQHVIAGIIPKGVPLFTEDSDQEEDDFYDQYKTHKTIQIDRVERPDDLDEDGYSESLAMHWNDDYAYTCNYAFQEIIEKPEEDPEAVEVDEYANQHKQTGRDLGV